MKKPTKSAEEIYEEYEDDYRRSAARNSMSFYEFVQEELALEKRRAAQLKARKANILPKAVKKATKEIALMAEKERLSKKKKATPTKKGNK
jgi:hypothetical protein